MSCQAPQRPELPAAAADLLERGAAVLGVRLDTGRRERLHGLLVLLERWNRAYNLTAVCAPLAMVPRHLLDSLAILPYLQGERVLDLGTGPGFPGLPLAICDPGRHYRLLDANGKKVRFIRQVLLDLGLGNVEPVQARMQTYRPPEKFSTIVSRAVATITVIHTAAAPLLQGPGRLLVMKGRCPQDELQDPALRGLDLAVHRLCVPFLEGERHLIEIRRE